MTGASRFEWQYKCDYSLVCLLSFRLRSDLALDSTSPPMLSFISTVRLRRIAADELLAFDFAGVVQRELLLLKEVERCELSAPRPRIGLLPRHVTRKQIPLKHPIIGWTSFITSLYGFLHNLLTQNRLRKELWDFVML